MKKYVSSILLASIVASMSVPVCASDISVEVMGNKLDAQTQIIDGRTMVPVRAIFEGVGANVEWNSDTKTVTGTMNDTVVEMSIDSDIVKINGEDHTMDAAPTIIDGRTYAPARYVAEGFGYKVDWDSENKVVKIVSDTVDKNDSVATSVETTTETTTEITTKETTVETTTETTTKTYEKYSKYYTGKDMTVGGDIPAGIYCVVPENGKVAYSSVYDYENKNSNNNANNKKYYFNGNVEYTDVVYIRNGQYATVTNGAFVATDLVEKKEPNRGGTYRVGTDLSAGHYTFKLSPYSLTGYIEIRNLAENENKTIYRLTEDDSQLTIKLDKNIALKIYGVDLLDSSLKKVSEFTPLVSTDDTNDEKYDFSEIRDSFKTKINSEISEEINSYTCQTKSGQRYTKEYCNSKVNSWKTAATNDAEKVYANIAGQLYTRFFNYVYASKPEVTKYSYVIVNGTTYTSSEYRKVLEGERDTYKLFASAFASSTSFKDCSSAYLNASSLYNCVPKGQGYGKN